MSKLIKNGTVVTADLTHKADVFVQHGKIVAIDAIGVAGRTPWADREN